MNDLFNISIQQAINEVLIIQNNLHFIRADWFYAFIPLFLFLYLSHKTTLNNKNWLGVIDQQLLPFVLSKTGRKQRRYPLLLIFIACSLCITALAGPVYKKLPQPVYREQSSLVILLDLSQSMNATDVKPSRLSRAKLELLDLLKTRKTGQTALIVYAADAFVVTPLTDDNATIANMVPSLTTDMMPAQGNNLSNALDKAFSLFSQAGIINGNILVITDDIHQRDEIAIKEIFSKGHRFSVFGIGTTEGAPVPLDGGFLQNSEGAIVIPKLYPARLQNYALQGGGLYSSQQADNSDIDEFTVLFQSTDVSKDIDTENLNANVWQEEGHWLLLPLLFFAALWARKGWLATLLLFVFTAIGPIAQPAYADTTSTQSNYLDTKNLWSRADQKAMQAFNSGDNKKAAENFTQPEWKASAFYRNNDFEAAAKTLENANSSDDYYNKGNALARLGKFEDAIKAYDKAIELNATNEDASYNREQVKQALKKQQQENQSQQDQKQQQDDQSQDSQQSDNQQQDDPQQNSEQQDEQQQSSQQSDKQSSDQPGKDNNESDSDQEQQSEEKTDPQEQQQMEQEQLEQRDAKAEAEQQKQEEQQYQQQQKEKQDETQQQDDQQQPPDSANKEIEHKDSEEKPLDIEVNPMEASITEDEKATEQWLKRIPDDPGGLLRRKFYYQYRQIPNQSDDNEPW